MQNQQSQPGPRQARDRRGACWHDRSDKSLTKDEYVRDLIRYQLQLRALAYQLYVQKRPLVIVYEGWDAGGKGGTSSASPKRWTPRL